MKRPTIKDNAKVPDVLSHQQLQLQFRELLDKAKNNQSVLERFQQFELEMLTADSLADLLETLLVLSLQHFNLCDCRMMWFERQQELCSLLSAEVLQRYGQCLVFNPISDEMASLFTTRMKPVLQVLSVQERTLWFSNASANVQSAAFIPLVCDGVLAGCYLLGSNEPARFTSDKAVDFMAHMGLIAAVCIQNSANKERIRLLGMMDTLTRIKNRRCFDSDISKEVARAQRAGEPLSCLFIDADFFKAINDNHGHQAGDEVLCSLAEWVKLQLREGDHLARYGGEEFVVLLPQCDSEIATHVAERIRYFVETQTVIFNELDIHITVSIGITTFNGSLYKDMERDLAIKALLKQADAAVYDAKQTGRNRICVREFCDNEDNE